MIKLDDETKIYLWLGYENGCSINKLDYGFKTINEK